MSNPTQTQVDDGHVSAVRDITVDLVNRCSPTVRALFLMQLNESMSHISKRLTALQTLEAVKPAETAKP